MPSTPISTSAEKHLMFFFLQAEDGIRDTSVTGVQTCALPISSSRRERARAEERPRRDEAAPPLHVAEGARSPPVHNRAVHGHDAHRRRGLLARRARDSIPQQQDGHLQRLLRLGSGRRGTAAHELDEGEHVRRLVAYWTLPERDAWPALLFASFVFYAARSVPFLVLLVACMLVGYASSHAIARPRGAAMDAPSARGLLTLTIVVLLSPLAFFKYANLAVEAVGGV